MKQDVTGRVRQERQGPFLVLTLAQAPANVPGPALCAELSAALAEAAADATVEAVILTSALADFSPGLPLAETVTAAHARALSELCRQVELMPRPVIAALGGAVLGAGLDLALAAQARVATVETRLGLPDVTVGLPPIAGASQRLPRLIGAEQALRMLLSGRPVPAVEALAMGLLDRVVEEGLLPAALSLAADLATRPPRPTLERREGLRDAVAFQQAVAAARRGLTPGAVEGSARIVDCVEAALLLPGPQGLEFETAHWHDLSAQPATAGLRHAALAEARATRLPLGMEGAKGTDPTRLVVWGATDAAPDIALAGLQGGLRVYLADPSRDVLVNALERIAVAQEAALRQGRLTQAALDDEWARLSPQLSPTRLPEAEVAILTAPDAPPVPAGAAVLTLLEPVPTGAMALSLSGALSGIPAGSQGDLAEIALSESVAPARAATAVAFARRVGWRALVTRPGATTPAAPAAVHLARAIAETVAHLERAGLTRTEVARALAAHGIAGEGLATRTGKAEAEIAARCIAAMANAGARLIGAGVLRRPCEVDMAALGAGLMARHTGGPMFQCDRRGMLVLMRDLRDWARESPALWQPAPLIENLWSLGQGFSSLDAAADVQARRAPQRAPARSGQVA